MGTAVTAGYPALVGRVGEDLHLINPYPDLGR
jgi:hypothetical protein